MSICITSITPTIAKAFGTDISLNSEKKAIGSVLDLMFEKGVKRIRKCLVYAPDAIGAEQVWKNPDMFKDVEMNIDIKEELVSVFPPKTPVCFASMFTGAMPDIHGIKKYEKPVVKIETIQETFPESEKARKALDNQNGNFLKLAQVFDEYWGNYDGILMYAPDHGCHEKKMLSYTSLN